MGSNFVFRLEGMLLFCDQSTIKGCHGTIKGFVLAGLKCGSSQYKSDKPECAQPEKKISPKSEEKKWEGVSFLKVVGALCQLKHGCPHLESVRY